MMCNGNLLARSTLNVSIIACLLAGCTNDSGQSPNEGPAADTATVSTQSRSASSQSGCTDIYLVNGRFFSMEELPQETDDGSISDFNSMRISENQIAETGDGLVGPDCAQTIDLDGKTVIPGFVDAHMHFVRATLRPGYDARELELSRSIPEAMEMIAARRTAMETADVPTDQWITFIGGWDPIQWEENPIGSGPRGNGTAYTYPSLSQMDAAAGDYPFYLHLRSNEAAYANSRGIARLNELAAASEETAGLEIDSATGFVADSATAFQLLKKDSDPRQQAIRVMHGFNRVGLTGVIDVGGSIRGRGAQYFDVFSDYETIKSLYDDDALTIRVRARVQGDRLTPLSEYESLVRSIAADFGSSDDSMYRVVGLGEDLGNIQTNGLQETFEMAIRNGWIAGKHAGSLDDINAYHAAEAAAGARTRFVLEHATPTSAEFDRIAELGYQDVIGINLAIHSFLGRGTAGRTCNRNPYRTASDLGLRIGIGTDSTNAQASNPWVNVYSMVTGKDVKEFALRAGGVTVDREGNEVTCPDERVSRARAIQMYTKGSAWLAGAEDEFGVLEAGKLADLIVVSEDVFDTDVSDDRLWQLHSLLTIVDGDIVYVDENAPFAAAAVR